MCMRLRVFSSTGNRACAASCYVLCVAMRENVGCVGLTLRTNGEENDVATCGQAIATEVRRCVGTGRIACATERQRQMRRPEDSGTKGKRKTKGKHKDEKKSLAAAAGDETCAALFF